MPDFDCKWIHFNLGKHMSFSTIEYNGCDTNRFQLASLISDFHKNHGVVILTCRKKMRMRLRRKHRVTQMETSTHHHRHPVHRSKCIVILGPAPFFH